jgi:hypothetical protein
LSLASLDLVDAVDLAIKGFLVLLPGGAGMPAALQGGSG